MSRAALGFLLAPVVAGTVTLALTVAAGETPARRLMSQASDLDPAAPGTVLGGALMSAAVVTMFGAVPIFRALRRKGLLRLGTHLVVGAALGATPFLLLGAMGILRAAVDRELNHFIPSLVRLLGDAIVGSLAGASAAFVFFLVFSRHEAIRSQAA